MLVKCDHCGKQFSMEGVTCGEFHEGEIQGKYFVCSKCGKKYIFGVTDQALREEQKAIAADREKLKVMLQKKFWKETTEKFRQEIQKRVKAAFIRGQELKWQVQNGGNHGQENPAETD